MFRRRSSQRVFTKRFVTSTAGSTSPSNATTTSVTADMSMEQLFLAGSDNEVKFVKIHRMVVHEDLYVIGGAAGNMLYVVTGAHIFERSGTAIASPWTTLNWMTANQWQASQTANQWPSRVLYTRASTLQMVAGSSLTNNSAMWQPLQLRTRRRLRFTEAIEFRAEVTTQQTAASVGMQYNVIAMVAYSLVS